MFARDKAITVRLQAPDRQTVTWDEEKLERLLLLLIENAVKYTPDGGKVDVTLAVVLEKGERQLAIEVQDNGIGISSEALPRIFDRSYRQDQTRTRRSGGHGLGLAIARNIVEMGRGTIRVESKEGVGSIFYVRIPLRENK